MKMEQIVQVDQEVLSGTPVFAGTRVPVRSLVDHIVAGDGLDEFLEGFPTVTRQQAEEFLRLSLQRTLDEVEYAADVVPLMPKIHAALQDIQQGILIHVGL